MLAQLVSVALTVSAKATDTKSVSSFNHFLIQMVDRGECFYPKSTSQQSWSYYGPFAIPCWESDPIPWVERLPPLATGLSEAGIKLGLYPSDKEPTTGTYLPKNRNMSKFVTSEICSVLLQQVSKQIPFLNSIVMFVKTKMKPMARSLFFCTELPVLTC